MEQELPLDPALVRRLSRPAARPSVIDHGPVRALIARHRGMAVELPLADLVSRHTGSVSDLAASALPVVYAQPAPSPSTSDSDASEAPSSPAASSPVVPARAGRWAWSPLTSAPDSDSGPSEVRPGPSASSPVVSARHPDRAVRPGDSMPAPTVSTVFPRAITTGNAAPAVRNMTPSPVVQRQVAAPSAPGVAPPDRAWSVPPSALSSLDLHLPHGGGRDFVPSGPGPTRSPGQAGSPQAVPSMAVSAGRGERPAVPADRVETPLVSARPMPWRVLDRPLRTDAHPGAAVVVSAQRPRSRPGVPLLLVDLAVAAARPARGHPDPGERRETPESLGWNVSGTGQRTVPEREVARSAAQKIARTPQPVRPEATPVDIAHIVDLVHNRFVRKLAVEAERRMVR
jgi:hypothetical protein